MLAALACAPVASAASLPGVSSGERPGPPVLYQRPPTVPELSVRAPFSAPPLLVSGSDAYRGGEYLHQDYLFDDRGADTVPLFGSRGAANPGSDIASSTGGDVFYPTGDRYSGNAADLVELRIKPTEDEIVYRVTLNTVKDEDAAVVGIGIDSDRSGGAAVAWPLGAGVSSPGLDRFITAFGTGGKVTTFPAGTTEDLPAGSVSVDTETNQMTIRVPRSIMNPGTATWRYVAGVGLWSGSGWQQAAPGTSPSAAGPRSGSASQSAPAVFNLGFRFREPQSKPTLPPYTTFPGIGNWFEDQQSRALLAGTTDCSFPGAPAGCRPFYADVSFAKLAEGADEQITSPAGREQARIMPSSLDLPEGLRSGFPGYGGRLQPYLLTVPPGYRRGRPAGLTFSLHSLGGTYTQYAVFSPTQLRQFGDERGNLVATPLARGTNGWYTDEAEYDVFEVWRDVAARFSLDPERTYLTGYSMGGYGTYKLGTHYPDLFARNHTTVGPPGREVWLPPGPPRVISDGGRPNASSLTSLVLENARWVPYMNWVAATDQLVPIVGPRAQQARFDELGLRGQLWTFQGEHFTLAILDRWDDARDFLGQAKAVRDPWRVNYAFVPAADRPRLGLVHDKAYWVSKLRVRDSRGDPGTDPALGEIDARSLVSGQRDPRTASFRRADDGPPSPAVVEGTAWTEVPRGRGENALELALDNVGAGTVDGRRARLRGDRRLRVRLRSDGSGRTVLQLPLPEGVTVRRTVGGPVPGASSARARAAASAPPEVDVSTRGATFTVASGTREYVFEPASSAQNEEPDDGPEGNDDRPEDDDRGTGGGGGGGGGGLPFTGLFLAAVLAVGLLLGGTGLALKRRA